nr:MAG TPA: hypothetical protein [Caudoviricetes sp.]
MEIINIQKNHITSSLHNEGFFYCISTTYKL